MSSMSLSVSRKRIHSSGFRDSVDFPPPKLKKHEHNRFPIALKEKLQNFALWITELPLKSYFAMALKAGSNINQEVILDDVDDDDDEEIKKISEVDPSELGPLIEQCEKLYSSENSRRKSRYSRAFKLNPCYDEEMNGSSSRGWDPRYSRNGDYGSKDSQTDNLEHSAVVSNPSTDIEILLGTKPKLAEADEIEILSELPSTKQKHASSQKLLRISRSSAAKSSLLSTGSSTSTPVKRLQSSTAKGFTANEVVRLQEKAQYKLLLEKYISGSHYHHVSKKPQSVDAAIQADIKFTGSHFKKEVLQQPIDSFIEQYYKPLYMPSPDKASSDKEVIEIKSDDDDDDDDDGDDDDELKILEVKLPKEKPKIHSKNIFTSEWLTELKSVVHAQTEERLKIVEEQERMLESFRQERLIGRLSKRDETGETVEPDFPKLTKEMEEEVDKALSPTPEEAFEKIGCGDLIRKDMETLAGLSWLNDAIINTYFELIVARSKEKGYPTVHAYSTFFYTTYKAKGYSGVQRWTRKIDIFSYDLNFIPIHLGVHWCLAVIDHREKKICYYDSMGNGEEQCLELLNKYLCHEYENKKGQYLDPFTYTKEAKKDIPQQMNGSDCGIFTLKYAEYVSRDAEITFNQNHMIYFRRRTAYELLKGQLL